MTYPNNPERAMSLSLEVNASNGSGLDHTSASKQSFLCLSAYPD